MCHECVKGGPGAVFADVITHRKLEVLALHFQTWKKHWRRNAFDVMSESNGTWPDARPTPRRSAPQAGIEPCSRLCCYMAALSAVHHGGKARPVPLKLR